MSDFRLHNVGSIVMIEPVTDAGRQWVDDNVALEGWQWLGPSFACEPRMVEVLASAILADDLEIEGDA